MGNTKKIRVGYGVTVMARGLRENTLDGIGSYSSELLHVFSKNKAVNLVKASFDEPYDDAAVLPRFDAQVAVSYLTRLPFYGASSLEKKVDVFHATDHLIPKLKTTPVIATIYDAIPLSNPEYIKMSVINRAKTLVWKSSSLWAQHVITISEYSKKNIQQYFGIREENITVTPLGVDERWFDTDHDDAQISSMFTLEKPYFIFIGTIQPRKNLDRVIQAYLRLPTFIKTNFSLVIIGRDGWGCDEVSNNLKNNAYGSGVIWLKYVSDVDVVKLLKHAVSLVFPSLAEGFGLPVLEAFAAQVPVITSNTTSLPEVAGDAALLVNPVSVDEIANAMQLIAESSHLSESLVTKGLIRAREFSWKSTALATIKVYQDVADLNI